MGTITRKHRLGACWLLSPNEPPGFEAFIDGTADPAKWVYATALAQLLADVDAAQKFSVPVVYDKDADVPEAKEWISAHPKTLPLLQRASAADLVSERARALAVKPDVDAPKVRTK